MKVKEFIKYYEELNNKNPYDEQYSVEHHEGENKITFFDKFIKVFGKYWFSYLIIDEGIGFINDSETTYIGESFLDFCIKHNIKGEKSWDFYHKNLEDNMGKEKISYIETFNNLNNNYK